MDKKILYRKAYRHLENVTPLKYDCGMLCNHKCCSGGEDHGMHLYPGEGAMFLKTPGFLSIKTEAFGSSNILFAVCSGKCNRKERPLACRVYPLVPFLDSAGRLHVIEDPRAACACPLLVLKEDYPIDAFFRHKVRYVFQLLVQDQDIKRYVSDLSDVLREYSAFTGSQLP